MGKGSENHRIIPGWEKQRNRHYCHFSHNADGSRYRCILNNWTLMMCGNDWGTLILKTCYNYFIDNWSLLSETLWFRQLFFFFTYFLLRSFADNFVPSSLCFMSCFFLLLFLIVPNVSLNVCILRSWASLCTYQISLHMHSWFSVTAESPHTVKGMWY
jgi:hypothetical protein